MLGELIKKHITLKPNQVSDFVNAATKCDFDVDIYYNRYVVDAKSILGVFGLDFTQPLTVEYRGYNEGFEQFLRGHAVPVKA
ncbi:MAG: HPr family phosphocarrier protein [Lachnospiraceae bacterium]|nr:HPr family phosphocarrier protein [Lachnospiraceae bacterium]